ncbi:hypothetical protein QO259_17215 [Salinicola sp. JS01]|uniref:hypothetical protein n=1 Tax=Salinicola sp. JS01 TaxID=3050071 RepID=UPI00255C0915|nr:hypothetical protein [Salinicola sp. JS01]WIX32528.1 hypothetical protein QO259_17215 [Salinicola sp. JS01]
MRQLELMGINQLLAVIRREPEGSTLRARALRRCLDELIEVEIEWRLDYRHLNLGHHKVSPLAGVGEGRGEVTGRVDHVMEAAERYRHACRWRSMAQALLAHLTERQRMAVLLAGYAIPGQPWVRPVLGDRERIEAIKGGHRGLTLAQVRDAQLIVLQRLGWPAFGGWGAEEWSLRRADWSLSPAYSAGRQRCRFKQWRPVSAREVFGTRKALERSAEKARARLLDVVSQQSEMAA